MIINRTKCLYCGKSVECCKNIEYAETYSANGVAVRAYAHTLCVRKTIPRYKHKGESNRGRR